MMTMLLLHFLLMCPVGMSW